MNDKSKEDQYLGSFFNYLVIEKGLSSNSIKAYKIDIKKFVLWLSRSNKPSFKNICESDLNEYIAFMFKNNGGKGASGHCTRANSFNQEENFSMAARSSSSSSHPSQQILSSFSKLSLAAALSPSIKNNSP
mgnify:CR=1 FL=1